MCICTILDLQFLYIALSCLYFGYVRLLIDIGQAKTALTCFFIRIFKWSRSVYVGVSCSLIIESCWLYIGKYLLYWSLSTWIDLLGHLISAYVPFISTLKLTWLRWHGIVWHYSFHRCILINDFILSILEFHYDIVC